MSIIKKHLDGLTKQKAEDWLNYTDSIIIYASAQIRMILWPKLLHLA